MDIGLLLEMLRVGTRANNLINNERKRKVFAYLNFFCITLHAILHAIVENYN